MDTFYAWLGSARSWQIQVAVMDMWKPFRTSTLKEDHAPYAAILYDKFHIMRHLGDALDTVRKSEYARLIGESRSYIKGQKYTLLSNRENLTLSGRKSLKKLLSANRRLNTAYLLKETVAQARSGSMSRRSRNLGRGLDHGFEVAADPWRTGLMGDR